MIRALIITIGLTVFWVGSGISQPSSQIEVEMDKIINHYRDSLGIAGLSVAIIQNGEVQYKKSFGYANLELKVPMRDSSVYRIWSVSKQFCAVAILKLEEEGLLKLDNTIDSYLDSIPKEWNDITIQQLLNHTAGIKDYLNDYPEGKKLHSRTFEEIVDSLQVPKFIPGSRWSYTNSGYWVLTRVVEKVTGKSYQDYLDEEYFMPFQMTKTQKMDYYSIIKNRVNGYRNVKGVMKNSTRYLDENHLADGDAELISTIDDLSKWTKALFSGELIKLTHLEKAWNKAKYDNGDPVDASSIIYYDEDSSYGMGWFISELDGYKIVWTPGAGRGFSTTIFSVLDLNLNIVVLCNARRFLIADKIAKEIARSIIK